MKSLPYFGTFQWNEQTIYLIGEDHSQDSKNFNVFESISTSSSNCKVAYYLEGFAVSDPSSLMLYFGQKDHRSLLAEAGIVRPTEDYRTIYLEKLMSVYIATDGILRGNGSLDPILQSDAASALSSLVIYISKSRHAYDFWTIDANRFHFLDDVVSSALSILRTTFLMDYKDAFQVNDKYKIAYKQMGNLLRHPYLLESDRLDVSLAIDFTAKDKAYFADLNQFAHDQIIEIAQMYKSTDASRSAFLDDFLIHPSEERHNSVVVDWRTSDMSSNIIASLLKNQTDYSFIRVGAAHVKGMKGELSRGLSKFRMEDEVVDHSYDSVLSGN